MRGGVRREVRLPDDANVAGGERLLESARAVPLGTAAYGVVVVLEVSSVWLLSWLWPGGEHATSALRLLMEFPGVVAIAYVATRVHRSAAFVLGGFMLGMAVLMLSLSEPVSRAFAIALLTMGPIAAVLGWLLDRTCLELLGKQLADNHSRRTLLQSRSYGS